MGNDHSRLKGLIIGKNAVEANDFWALYDAESPTTSNEEGRQMLSVFQGETVVNGQLWSIQGPMERAIKNFMIYRHPYILKYVSTWEQGGQKHLATERVRPLASVLATMSDIQLCLGLRTILCSLIFLVEKALARHLNICISSIYVRDDGSWRLAGFEYVWKHKDINRNLLDLASAHRYRTAIDPDETKEKNSDFIEQYAFATLCEEILSKSSKTEVATPHVEEFREYCTTHLKHKNAQMRPKLSAVLLHPYFNHEFVLIHSFLFELPLKGLQEKQEFFSGLVDRLRYFNEEVVGAQLAADLLSRMVLLDPTAQLCVTPYVLRTKVDHSAALFANQTYVRYVMPHIKKMFRLRDAQIRLILLEYFMDYVRLLDKEELSDFILPHLLAGMNDTNDVLVAKTLRCLADIIPILGSTTVLGGARSRLFSDGRPQAAVPDTTTHWVEPRSITPVLGGGVEYMVSDSPIPADSMELSGSMSSLPQIDASEEQLQMPRRLSPDGGEDDKTVIAVDGINSNLSSPSAEANGKAETNTTEPQKEKTLSSSTDPPFVTNENDEEAWSDWETDELQCLNGAGTLENEKHLGSESYGAPSYEKEMTTSTQQFLPTNSPKSPSQSMTSSMSSIKQIPLKTINDDLNSLDIKIQKIPSADRSEEIDFFKDMEPLIASNPFIAPLTAVSADIGGNPDPTPTADTKTNDDHHNVKIDASRFAAMDTTGEGDKLAFNDFNEGDGWGAGEDDDIIDLDIKTGGTGETANA